MEGMESAILEMEKEAERLEILLHDPTFLDKRFLEIPQLSLELEQAKSSVAKLYTRWEELEAIRENAAS